MNVLTVKDRTDDLFRVLSFDGNFDYASDCRQKAEMAMKILDETIHINAKSGRMGDTILLKALRLCEHVGEKDYMFKLVKKIVDTGADVNMSNGIGEFPLQIALLAESFGMVAFLVHRKANVNRMVDFGTSVLQYAIETPYVANKLIELIIHSGADVNMSTGREHDILYNTILWHGGISCILNNANSRELVTILIANGANPHSLYVKELLQEAQEYGIQDEIESVWEEIIYNAKTLNYNRVESLLELSEGCKMPLYFELPFVMQEIAGFIPPCI